MGRVVVLVEKALPPIGGVVLGEARGLRWWVVGDGMGR